MKKNIFWLMTAAMLCSAPVFTACDDDDDDNTSTEETTGVNPVKDKDFTVAVSGNSVTVASSLEYGNMWVTYNGTQYKLTDGQVVITIPTAGDYTMTFSYYNTTTYTSDEFSVTITATDLSFLDEGVFKTLTGGKAVYEAATADANGYKFTRSWRLDAFLSEIGQEYTKAGYNDGVGFFGDGTDAWWACAGSYKGSWQNDAANGITDCAEDATIAFDPVNNVVKFTVVTAYDTTYVTGMKANAGAYADGKLAEGTYYTQFTYNEVAEQYGSAGAAAQIASNAGTTLSDSYLEIKFAKTAIGNNGFVRMPLNKIYAGWTSIFENQFLNIKIMTDETGNALHAVLGRSVDGGAKAGDSEGDNCLLFYTYVADELDAAGAYTYEIPSYTVDNVLASSVEASAIQGTWKITTTGSPFGWVNWANNMVYDAWADFETAANTVLSWWAFGNPDEEATVAKKDATIAAYTGTYVTLNSDGSYVVNDAMNEYAEGAYTAKEYTGTYKYNGGYITFSDDVTITCASVTLSGKEFYVVAPEGNASAGNEGEADNEAVTGGLWIGQTNGDKTETAAIHFAKAE
ncbi:MAG: hypothetical protein E7069_00305 [Bacteroidales bacterium]|jgi:hypothetical protein|nr:hypothetical protein [Bacteroidales bacterium]